ncbi:MAG TPA: hypothetical protein V6D15_24985 [Oculatellaceae cyanobacterium]|jgi:hypothetical protein
MRPDLEGLEITKGEVRRLTGIDKIFDLNSNPFEIMILSILCLSIIWEILLYSLSVLFKINHLEVLKALLENLKMPAFLIYMAILFLPPLIISTWITISIKKKEQIIKNNKPLMKLRNELNHYNKLIYDIDVLDQLEAAGNPVNLSDRNKVIEAIKITRENLVRAFKTEKILREHPNFKPDSFVIDLTALNALQTSEQANDYGRLLNETLQIAVNMQEEMSKLTYSQVKS